MTPLPGAVIRPAVAADRVAIEKIFARTGLFREAEIAVALELIDVYLDSPGQEDYLIYTAMAGQSVAGYTCFGLNTMTAGTFELYWIAVDPAFQRRGIGGALLSLVETEARRTGGRMVCAETSSRDDYGPTLLFYQRHGYRETALVPDYYAPGDDKIILVKIL